MEKELFPQLNRFPILVEGAGDERICYFLGNDGCLHQFQAGKEDWYPVSSPFGEKHFRGFDAAIDMRGSHLLIAFDERGALFLAEAGRDGNTPAVFYEDPDREIVCLSACRDSKNILHLLHLSAGRENGDSRLIYHRFGQGQWGNAVTLDFGPGRLHQHVHILEGPENLPYIFYYLENDSLRPVLRRFQGGGSLDGAIHFPGNWGSSTLLPSFCLTADQTLHCSLVSRQPSGASQLHYAGLRGDRWVNNLTLEVTPFTLPLAPLYSRGKQLLLAWKNHHNMLSCLLSDNAGRDWQRAGSSPLGQYTRLFRLRTVFGRREQNEKWQAGYLFADGLPPLQLIRPEGMIGYRNEAGPYEEEFQNLGHLYSSLAAHAGQIQSTNINLQSRLSKKEQEYYQLYTRSISQIKEFQKTETSFKSTIKDLQNLLQHEKMEREEKLEKQAGEVSLLKEEIRRLQAGLADRGKAIRQLEEKNSLLAQENAALHKKREYFWQRFIK